jgi:ATP-binding cassette, subfamily C, bacterial
MAQSGTLYQCHFIELALLRLIGIGFSIIQTKQFSRLSKDVIFQIRKNLLQRLQVISMSEYESLGSGTVISHLVTDLDTLDQFIGTTMSKFLVAFLTVLGTAAILLWMHWQLGLFILCLNPVVIYFTRRSVQKSKTEK